MTGEAHTEATPGTVDAVDAAARARDCEAVPASGSVDARGLFDAAHIDWVTDAYFCGGTGPGSLWERSLKDAHLALPEWFRHGLDPHGRDYAEQQQRLWSLISGVERGYRPEVDEREHSWAGVDPVRAPGFFSFRDRLAVGRAGDHTIATGMILKHSGLVAGDRALEYGAGFGHTALALARLGVQVDTVDISPVFCDFVRQQAEFHRVPLTAFEGRFGCNPRPGERYRLIWFYESFHHCLDFEAVVAALSGMLSEDGAIILGGEPIVEREYAAVPYPWGMRLHSEVVAVVRRQHWLELGFSEDFLATLFTRHGFVGERIECEPSLFGRLYRFRRRPEAIALATAWLPTECATGWHPPTTGGRWTRGVARLAVDSRAGFSAIEIELGNPSALGRRVEVTYGPETRSVSLPPYSTRTLRLDAAARASFVAFRSAPRWRVSVSRRLRIRASRAGVMVRCLRYLP